MRSLKWLVTLVLLVGCDPKIFDARFNVFSGSQFVDLEVVIAASDPANAGYRPNFFMSFLDGNGIYPSTDNPFIVEGDVLSTSVTFRMPVDPGLHQFQAQADQRPGVVVSLGGDCDAVGVVDVPGDGTVPRCIMTVDDASATASGTLSIVVTVVNQNSNNTQANFLTSLSGVQITDGEPVLTKTYVRDLSPGTYQVIQSSVAGYTLVYGEDCDPSGLVTVQTNSSRTCTLTTTEATAPDISLGGINFIPQLNQGAVTYLLPWRTTSGSDDLSLNMTIPAGLIFGSASDGGQQSGGSVVWSLGSQPANTSNTVSVQFLLPSSLDVVENATNIFGGGSASDTRSLTSVIDYGSCP